jgi:orotidine-5'-phosphate decarboxylase
MTSPIPIIALDVPTLADARALVARVGPAADFFKVGLQLYTREGPPVVEWLRGEGKRVFLDLKLHDIPNTVGRAAASAAALGVDLLTVHAVGGEAMLRAAVEGAREGGASTGILAVTVLTSFDDAAYAAATLNPGIRAAYAVAQYAAVAARAGARGVVCAGAEAAAVRRAHGEGFGTLVPGLRAAGATWVVVGRMVTAAADPAAAFAGAAAALRGA